MDNEHKIRLEAKYLIKQNKEEYSITETTILIQSLYFDIEDIFTYSSNLKSENINEIIEVSETIISSCTTFFLNLELIPITIRWEDLGTQINRVNGIKYVTNKLLDIHRATKDFQEHPSIERANRLQFLMAEIENEDFDKKFI